jgi:hypothetical protein
VAVFHGSSPVGDWSVLLERLARAGVFGRWQQQEPALAAVPCLTDLPSHTGRGSDPADSDEIVGALVRLAAADGMADPDAALVLVHLLSDGIVALAGRLNRGSPSRRALCLVVGELTCRIRSFPWRRRTRAHAANLLLDTKHALLRELPQHGPDGAPRDVLLDPFNPVWSALLTDPAPAVTAEGDLAELLGWAGANQVAGADDLRLLVRLHELSGYGTGSRHRVAAEFGINEKTLRRRRDRTLAALRAAGPRFLTEQAA